MANNPGGPPSLEKRLPIALALMMLVLLVSQYLFKPAPGPKPVTPVNNKAAATLAQKPEPPIPAAQVTLQIPATAGQVQAAAETTNEIDTSLYHIVFTNRGAAVKSWVLKRYRDDAGKPLEVINTSAKDVPLPFTIEVTGEKLPFDPNTVLYQARLSPNGLGIDYEFSDGKTTVRKSFQFSQDSYLSQIKSVVIENNTPVPHLLMWRGGFGDQKVRNASSREHTVRYDTGAGK